MTFGHAKGVKSKYSEGSQRGKPVRLWGPPGLIRFMSASRSFARLRFLDLYVYELASGHVVLPAAATRHVQFTLYAAKTSKRGPQSTVSLSLLSECADIPGKLDGHKLKRLGIKGPLCGALKRGEDVIQEDGTVLRAAEFLGPGRKGASFLVVPNDSFTPELVQCSLEEEVLTGRKRIHSPVETASLSRVFLMGTTADPDFWAGTPVTSQDTDRILPVSEDSSLLLEIVRSALPGMVPRLPPSVQLSSSSAPLSTFTFLPSIEEPAAPSADPTENDSDSFTGPPMTPAVTVLGSGSAIPGKYRNVSAVALDIDADTRLLFDCGEGTVAQMLAYCTPSEGARSLENTSTVAISHAHADHHNGLLNLLACRTGQSTRIFLPASLEHWMSEICGLFGFEVEVFLPMSKTPLITHPCPALIQPVPVPHMEWQGVPDSFGFVVREGDTPLVAYSGDCRPSESFAAAARGVRLLIHEATFPSGMEGEAKAKQHCTVAEAIATAVQAECHSLLLTHFSQRQAKCPEITEDEVESFTQKCKGNLYFAFDQLQLAVFASADRMNSKHSRFDLPKVTHSFLELFKTVQTSRCLPQPLVIEVRNETGSCHP